MRISTCSTPSEMEGGSLAGHTAVVIDVLRATTVMVTALSAGALSVFPVAEVEEALLLADAWGRDKVVLGGERKGLPIPGFDLGNSPREYTAGRVAGRTVVLTTTNGTGAVLAASGAQQVLIACLRNASAAAEAVRKAGRDAVLLMAGTHGRFSLDDALAAGALLSALPEAEADDLGQACLSLYAGYAGNLPGAVRALCGHGRYLDAIGCGEDIAFCMERDALSLVPRFDGQRVSV